MSENKCDADSIIETALDSGAIRTFNGIPYAIVGKNSLIKYLEELNDAPKRINQAPQFFEVPSFLQYINRFKVDGSLIIFAGLNTGQPGGRITAILDYHQGPEDPSWCTHKPSLHLLPSVEWVTWATDGGKWRSQLEMAEHLQDNALDVVTPDGATLLELVETLRVTSRSEFLSQNILRNGQTSIAYTESTSTAAGDKGSTTLPEKFTIGIPILQNGDRYKIDVRLRSRIVDKKLSLRYDIITVAKVVETAHNKVIAEIENGLQEKVILGNL